MTPFTTGFSGPHLEGQIPPKAMHRLVEEELRELSAKRVQRFGQVGTGGGSWRIIPGRMVQWLARITPHLFQPWSLAVWKGSHNPMFTGTTTITMGQLTTEPNPGSPSSKLGETSGGNLVERLWVRVGWSDLIFVEVFYSRIGSHGK